MDTIKFVRLPSGELSCESPELLPEQVVATIGVFDGVHGGHRFLLEQLKHEAQRLRLPSAVITFDTPPVMVVRPDHPFEKLNSNTEREQLLAKTGVDFLFLLPFDWALAALSAEEFFRHIITRQLHVHTLLMGYDHHFGRPPKAGDPPTDYKSLGEKWGVRVLPQEPFFDKEEGKPYSSSRIRKLLRADNLSLANQLLGYNYHITGEVKGGLGIGKTLGFPTANIQPEDAHKLIPPLGVYAVWAHLGEARYGGMLYIGNRPTIADGLERTIEVNLFNFQGNLYDKKIAVELIAHTRGEARFSSYEELSQALRQDAEITRGLLSL